MTDSAALIARAKAYGCDIRATHESLMLVGDLADRIAALEQENESLRRMNRNLAAQNGYTAVTDAEDRATKAEAEAKAYRDALEEVVALDDGDVPALWTFAATFDRCRAALAGAKATRG